VVATSLALGLTLGACTRVEAGGSLDLLTVRPHPLAASTLVSGSTLRGPPGAASTYGGSWGYVPRIHWMRTATFTTAFGLVRGLTKAPRSASWTGSILLDDAFRSGLRAGSKSGRRTASDISDGLRFAPLLPYVLLDPFLAEGWDERGAMLVNLWETVMASQFLTDASKNATARERPFGPECATDPSYDRDCGSRAQNASFFSGHTSLAFTFAGATCANHWRGRMVGTKWVDRAICGFSFATAMATGLLRIVADKHWSSDAVAGAAVGYISGYFLHWPARPGPREQSLPLRPVASGDSVGLRYARRF
jgi:membrane-associated phospholipid phosphatase